VIAIRFGGVFKHGGVEMPIIAIYEFANRAGLRAAIVRGLVYPLSLHGKSIPRFSTNEHAFFWGELKFF
jgi:hypothetical protein